MLSAHLNTARPWYEETTPGVAAQTVGVGGGEGASRLLLPVELPATVAQQDQAHVVPLLTALQRAAEIEYVLQ